jgi:hypothetical protein
MEGGADGISGHLLQLTGKDGGEHAGRLWLESCSA